MGKTKSLKTQAWTADTVRVRVRVRLRSQVVLIGLSLHSKSAM